MAFPPAASTDVAVSSIVPETPSLLGDCRVLLAVTTTVQPARPSSIAIAFPAPREAPVTTAIRGLLTTLTGACWIKDCHPPAIIPRVPWLEHATGTSPGRPHRLGRRRRCDRTGPDGRRRATFLGGVCRRRLRRAPRLLGRRRRVRRGGGLSHRLGHPPARASSATVGKGPVDVNVPTGSDSPGAERSAGPRPHSL